MKNTTRYIIIPQGTSVSRAWAIRDLNTGFIVKQGFASIDEATKYLLTFGQ